MLYHAGTNHIHIDSLNRAVLEENRSIKTVSETCFCNINYLAWPDPISKLGSRWTAANGLSDQQQLYLF